MQEGILSLMQLPRTTVGVQMLREARKPYIVVLTNPTTGGVTASSAPSTSPNTAWLTWSCTGTSYAPRLPNCAGC